METTMTRTDQNRHSQHTHVSYIRKNTILTTRSSHRVRRVHKTSLEIGEHELPTNL